MWKLRFKFNNYEDLVIYGTYGYCREYIRQELHRFGNYVLTKFS